MADQLIINCQAYLKGVSAIFYGKFPLDLPSCQYTESVRVCDFRCYGARHMAIMRAPFSSSVAVVILSCCNNKTGSSSKRAEKGSFPSPIESPVVYCGFACATVPQSIPSELRELGLTHQSPVKDVTVSVVQQVVPIRFGISPAKTENVSVCLIDNSFFKTITIKENSPEPFRRPMTYPNRTNFQALDNMLVARIVIQRQNARREFAFSIAVHGPILVKIRNLFARIPRVSKFVGDKFRLLSHNNDIPVGACALAVFTPTPKIPATLIAQMKNKRLIIF